MYKRSIIGSFLFLFIPLIVFAQDCIECHYEVTPKAVSDWQISKHSENDIDCSVCHGSEHTTMEDYAKAKLPTYETCGGDVSSGHCRPYSCRSRLR